MSQYYSPAKEVPSIGRLLRHKDGLKVPIKTLLYMLKRGEVLVGWYSNGGTREIAPILESQGDLDQFYQQYRMGLFVNMNYYAIPKEKLNRE